MFSGLGKLFGTSTTSTSAPIVAKSFASSYALDYGLKKAIQGADVCEKQEGVLCGQHSINNLLQEQKVVSLMGNQNLFVSGSPPKTYTNPDGRCYSIIDMLENPAIKINMKAVCALDKTAAGIGYCDRRTGFYTDESLEYVLNNLLRYDVKSVGSATGITEDFDIWTTDVINKFKNDQFFMGILINLGMVHWTCITRGMASCPADRPNAYLDSQLPGEALCLSNDELLNFFREFEPRIRGYVLVGYGSKGATAYNSVAKQNIEVKRLAETAILNRVSNTEYESLSNYIFEITGRRFSFQSGDKKSDALKALRLSARGPKTAEELQRIAISRNFLKQITDYLSDYEGYPGPTAATVAASALVSPPPVKIPKNIKLKTALVSPPLTTPQNIRLKELSKHLGNSVNAIKAAYSQEQIDNLFKIYGIKAMPTLGATAVPVVKAPVAKAPAAKAPAAKATAAAAKAIATTSIAPPATATVTTAESTPNLSKMSMKELNRYLREKRLRNKTKGGGRKTGNQTHRVVKQHSGSTRRKKHNH